MTEYNFESLGLDDEQIEKAREHSIKFQESWLEAKGKIKPELKDRKIGWKGLIALLAIASTVATADIVKTELTMKGIRNFVREKGTKTYTVVKGDCYDTIIRKAYPKTKCPGSYSQHMTNFETLNPDIDINKTLYPGTKIILPDN